MRPIWMEYPEDAETFSMENQFLVGKYEEGVSHLESVLIPILFVVQVIRC